MSSRVNLRRCPINVLITPESGGVADTSADVAKVPQPTSDQFIADRQDQHRISFF
jgi:hypothetical protein